MLITCRDQFAMYAQNHRAKNTLEATIKAEVNEQLVLDIQKIIEQPEPMHVLEETANFGVIAYADSISAKNQQTQLGVHFEEVAEMLDEIGSNDPQVQYFIGHASDTLNDLAETLKKSHPNIFIKDRLAFLDACCDQLVTATLSAVLHGMDPVGGLSEVNRSNYSKLTGGVMVKAPVTAKWVKGPNYIAPDLKPFI
jgi:predicted HAD superfamily Cof-like phosphohydrolase